MKAFRIIVLIIVILIASSYITQRLYSPLDGYTGLIFGILHTEDTEYAKGYSDEGFLRVTVGMSQDEVHRILGPPLDKWDIKDEKSGNAYGERWSRSPGDTDFRCRVLLYRDNIVYEKHAEFYLD
jgi:hypothetical protein